MATIAIGDIHGNLAALDDLLCKLTGQFEEHDMVVFLGDYIDRGPHSRGCIERIIEFRRSSPARVVTLLGNHEDWLLKTIHDPTRHSWILGMEAFATIESYSKSAADELRRALADFGPRVVTERIELPYRAFLDEVPIDHLDFLKELVPYCRTADAVFVHAGLDPKVERVEEQDRDMLIWGGRMGPPIICLEISREGRYRAPPLGLGLGLGLGLEKLAMRRSDHGSDTSEVFD